MKKQYKLTNNNQNYRKQSKQQSSNVPTNQTQQITIKSNRWEQTNKKQNHTNSTVFITLFSLSYYCTTERGRPQITTPLSLISLYQFSFTIVLNKR